MFQYKINVNELIAMLFVKDSVAKKGQTGFGKQSQNI